MSATPLYIREVKVRHLRCHDEVVWQCESGMNLIVGANGSGKTTLLEAVYLMAFGRSFRQARDPFLVKRDSDRFFIHGQWQRYGPMNLSVAGRKGKTTLRLQGRDVQRRKDVSESFPVLVEAPQGRKIIDGASGERRRWLDGLIITCFQNIATYYERYLRAVMQRGRLLRRRVSSDELEVWEQQIVHYGMPIVQAREKMITELNQLLIEEVGLTEHPLMISMTMPEYNQQNWLLRLQEKRSEDLRVGLRYGPHCDVVNIHFQQREIRSAGSRGQQKLAAIAIKMAECAIWSRYRRLIPVLLLDDCLEALDRTRQQRLFNRLQNCPAQILMTAPEGVEIASDLNIRIQLLDTQGLCDSATGSKVSMQEDTTVVMEEAA
ncbi:DNA replication and repair protein RecF [Mariprofundus ferrinatatus]|uniref:DNA replication and repair protein RecF n=1 Tax=Mariprofundus ferrinatatus TaxID=1921087 RepID=A0A2K8L0W9_9PROT|nr:DNA replication and repair protein RecF [Mariprofundus ferrinatatus]ATX80883.1 DNA replication and repair protein RecF [Mariprofundus ferrinatatus]